MSPAERAWLDMAKGDPTFWVQVWIDPHWLRLARRDARTTARLLGGGCNPHVTRPANALPATHLRAALEAVTA